MANKFAPNYPVINASSIFNCIWKWTRVMKAAGWYVKASSNGITKDTSGQASNDLWGTNADPMNDTYATVYPYFTTVAAGSNGVNINTFTGTGTLNVASTSGFPSIGAVMVPTSVGNMIVTYTGTTATSFTGCTSSGSGTLATSSMVSIGPYTTVTAASNNTSVTSTTLNALSTAGFPNAGTLYVYSNNGVQPVTYTGISGNTFTGCTSTGTGTVFTNYPLNLPAISFDNPACWIVLSGPQTIKIPLNANPSGTFLRGEICTQTTTGATGELLGYVWDAGTNSGWAGFLPQTGVFNCTTANTITGNSSGATMQPLTNGTLNTFNREVMIEKGSTNPTTSGIMYYICASALDGYGGGTASTTVTAASNNTSVTSGTINVVSTSGFPTAGSIAVQTLTGSVTVSYTNTTGTSFTGCTTTGVGNMVTGTIVNTVTTVASGSNGATVSSVTTLSVASTTGFSGNGYLLVTSSTGSQKIQYTGISGSTFTGCSSLGTGTLSTGNAVVPAGPESDQLWSTLSTQTGCNASSAGPGTGGTNNAFPLKGLVISGTANSGSSTGWFFQTGAVFGSYAQIACVNTIPSAGVSADGSSYIFISYTGTSNTLVGTFGLQRLDNTEPGDIDPFVFITSHSANAWFNVGSGTTNTSTVDNTVAGSYIRPGIWLNGGGIKSHWYGYQGRGHPNTGIDQPVGFALAPHWNESTGNWPVNACGGLNNPLRILNSPAAVKPLVFEPMQLVYPFAGAAANISHYKGRFRWVFFCPMGNWLTTFANKTLLCFAQSQPTGFAGFAIGPWDGVTTPLF